LPASFDDLRESDLRGRLHFHAGTFARFPRIGKILLGKPYGISAWRVGALSRTWTCLSPFQKTNKHKQTRMFVGSSHILDVQKSRKKIHDFRNYFVMVCHAEIWSWECGLRQRFLREQDAQ
jgi:hypothetical protein